jgi:predicted RNase H-like HicB family nuclease
LEQHSQAGGLEGRTLVKYAVVFERTKRSYAAYVPDLPGCVATGATRADVEKRIREAIALHVEGLRRERLPVPRPAAWSDQIEVSA